MELKQLLSFLSKRVQSEFYGRSEFEADLRRSWL